MKFSPTTHQQLTLICAITLWHPPYTLIWSKTKPLPKVSFSRTPGCICERAKLRPTIRRIEVDAGSYQRVTCFLGEWPTSKSLGREYQFQLMKGDITVRTTFSSERRASRACLELTHSSKNAGTTSIELDLVACTTLIVLSEFGMTGALIGSQ